MKSIDNVRSTQHNVAKRAPLSPAEQAWHVLSLEAIKDSLQTDVTRGLSPIEAERRLAEYGHNTLAQVQQRSAFSILLSQFQSLIVALLVAATVIACAMGDNIEAVAILVVIVLNAAIGFFTEWKAEQALSALQQQAVPKTSSIEGHD